jgi:DNA-binding NarL/FixJ family response regulator
MVQPVLFNKYNSVFWSRSKLEMRHFQPIDRDPGNSVPRPAECRELVRGMGSAAAEPTSRELEVENLLCRGYSQRNIAAIFGRSVSTVSVQVTSLYRKRGVHTQVELLLAYLERQGIFVFEAQVQTQANGDAG